jgi:hypothetical protein
MKKILLTLCLFIYFASQSFSQTATNFTCDDCDGVNHDLFSVLDQNKVVILIWVMPCGQCILPSKTAYNIYKSYQNTHPGKVLYYLCDDMANNTCGELQAWATTNKFFDVPLFVNESISMFDYDGPGMPKIAIVAGANHKVYNTQENTFNTQEILDAIDLAIEETSGIEDLQANKFTSEVVFNMSDNSHQLILHSIEPETIEAQIINATGQVVNNLFHGNINPGENQFKINSSEYSAGLYFVKISVDGIEQSIKFIVN